MGGGLIREGVLYAGFYGTWTNFQLVDRLHLTRLKALKPCFRWIFSHTYTRADTHTHTHTHARTRRCSRLVLGSGKYSLIQQTQRSVHVSMHGGRISNPDSSFEVMLWGSQDKSCQQNFLAAATNSLSRKEGASASVWTSCLRLLHIHEQVFTFEQNPSFCMSEEPAFLVFF